MVGEEVEYRGRIIHLVQAIDGLWSVTVWRNERTLEQLNPGLSFSATRDKAVAAACRLIDRDYQTRFPTQDAPEAAAPHRR